MRPLRIAYALAALGCSGGGASDRAVRVDEAPTVSPMVFLESGSHRFTIASEPVALEVRSRPGTSGDSAYDVSVELVRGDERVSVVGGASDAPVAVHAWTRDDAIVIDVLPEEAAMEGIIVRYQIVGGALRQTGETSYVPADCADEDDERAAAECQRRLEARRPEWARRPR